VESLTIEQFVIHLAGLGGHLGRKSDGHPGWRMLWYGLEKLLLILRGLQTAQQKCGEHWAWTRSSEELVYREDSPRHSPEGRPSHADHRKALQAECLEREISQFVPRKQMQPKFLLLLQRLLSFTLAG